MATFCFTHFYCTPDYSHCLFFLLSPFPSSNLFCKPGTSSSYIILMCSKLVTIINWLSNYWKIKCSPDLRFHRSCSGIQANIVSSDMHIMLQVKCLQGYSRQISCCPFCKLFLLLPLENSTFPFFFLNPSVFQFWSYFLSEFSLTTQNKPKLPHPLQLLCFTAFKLCSHSFIYLQYLFTTLLWTILMCSVEL